MWPCCTTGPGLWMLGDPLTSDHPPHTHNLRSHTHTPTTLHTLPHTLTAHPPETRGGLGPVFISGRNVFRDSCGRWGRRKSVRVCVCVLPGQSQERRRRKYIGQSYDVCKIWTSPGAHPVSHYVCVCLTASFAPDSQLCDIQWKGQPLAAAPKITSPARPSVGCGNKQIGWCQIKLEERASITDELRSISLPTSHSNTNISLLENARCSHLVEKTECCSYDFCCCLFIVFYSNCWFYKKTNNG